MNTTAVVIARFQTPYLHEGHIALLDQIKAKHNKVVVVLGVSPVKVSKRNPFDFYTREKLIKRAYPDFIILPFADHPSDETWSIRLDAMLFQCFPNEDFLLYGGRDSFIPCYSGCLKVEELPGNGTHSSTLIRNEYADKVLESEDFRLGVNYASHNSYSKVYPTVDVALFKENRKYILLGKKDGKDGWRLPGGFVDVDDKDFESAARREVMEECGSIEVGPMQFVGSAKIDDWRYRLEEDKIMTILFATDLLFGHARAGDDLQEVQWFEVAALSKMSEEGMITGEHLVLIDLIQNRILGKEAQRLTKSLIYENE